MKSFESIRGGDINAAFRLSTNKGDFFLKGNSYDNGRLMLESEAVSLRAIAASDLIRTPDILGLGTIDSFHYLLMTFIESGPKDDRFWKSFGASLAKLHQVSAADFGYPSDNFIGRLPQYNEQDKSWARFYQKYRLEPQVNMAVSSGLISPEEQKLFDKLYQRLPALLGDVTPSLIHGDLWSGNFLCTDHGAPCLIDPASCHADGLMDIAMSMLFGGFHDTFYEAYKEEASIQHFESSRIKLYQLYYLLVHLNLFGRSYWSAIESIVKRY